jgi:Yip1 domain
MFNRIMGVITLNASAYREIADDTTATNQALIIVIVVALIRGFFSGLVRLNGSGGFSASLGGAIGGMLAGVLIGLLAWVVAAWVLSFVAGWFGGKTNTGEMLRVTGYVQVFGLVTVLSVLILIAPILGCLSWLISLAIAILSLVGFVIGVREAAEFGTGNAIITAIIAAIVNFLIYLVVGGVLTAFVVGLFSFLH